MLNSCLSTKTNKSLVGGSYGGSWRDAKTNQGKIPPTITPSYLLSPPTFFFQNMILSHLLIFRNGRGRGTACCMLVFCSAITTHICQVLLLMHQVTTLCFTKCSQVVEQIWNMYHSQKIFVLLELVYHRWCWNLVPCSSFRQGLENEPKKSICHTHWLVRNCVNELY